MLKPFHLLYDPDPNQIAEVSGTDPLTIAYPELL